MWKCIHAAFEIEIPLDSQPKWHFQVDGLSEEIHIDANDPDGSDGSTLARDQLHTGGYPTGNRGGQPAILDTLYSRSEEIEAHWVNFTAWK